MNETKSDTDDECFLRLDSLQDKEFVDEANDAARALMKLLQQMAPSPCGHVTLAAMGVAAALAADEKQLSARQLAALFGVLVEHHMAHDSQPMLPAPTSMRN